MNFKIWRMNAQNFLDSITLPQRINGSNPFILQPLTHSTEGWYRKWRAVGSQSIAMYSPFCVHGSSLHGMRQPLQNRNQGHELPHAMPSFWTLFRKKGYWEPRLSSLDRKKSNKRGWNSNVGKATHQSCAWLTRDVSAGGRGLTMRETSFQTALYRLRLGWPGMHGMTRGRPKMLGRCFCDERK